MTSALVNLREQYTQQWNLTVQREITSRVAFTAAYVGSRTVRLQQGQRRNDPPPGPGAIQARRPYPQWGAIGLQEWGGKGTYNALQTSLEVRDWHGLTLMGSFVRAKCLDNGTDDSGAPSMALIGLNYAPCDFDQANTSSDQLQLWNPGGPGQGVPEPPARRRGPRAGRMASGGRDHAQVRPAVYADHRLGSREYGRGRTAAERRSDLRLFRRRSTAGITPRPIPVAGRSSRTRRTVSSFRPNTRSEPAAGTSCAPTICSSSIFRF